jgi:hypothetical protein
VGPCSFGPSVPWPRPSTARILWRKQHVSESPVSRHL